MSEFNLVKIDQTEHSTLSKMMKGSEFICFVIEDGEHENKIHGSTRIPAGRYKIVRDTSSRFTYHYGFVWHVLEVPNFSEIKIHKGNRIDDTEGCLLPNLYAGFDGKNFYGVNSKQAYERWMDATSPGFEHWLDVIR